MRNTSLDLEFKKQFPTASAFLHLLCKPSSVTATIPTTINLPLIPQSVQCRVKDKSLEKSLLML